MVFWSPWDKIEIKDLATFISIFGAVIAVSSAILIFGGKCLYDHYSQKSRHQYNQSHNQVLVKADKNKDGITTEQEWIEVYKTLGIQYDAVSPSNPRELSTSDLERYLELKASE